MRDPKVRCSSREACIEPTPRSVHYVNSFPPTYSETFVGVAMVTPGCQVNRTMRPLVVKSTGQRDSRSMRTSSSNVNPSRTSRRQRIPSVQSTHSPSGRVPVSIRMCGGGHRVGTILFSAHVRIVARCGTFVKCSRRATERASRCAADHDASYH